MPENLQIQQQKKNLVLLTWRNGRSTANVSANNDNDVRYLVEERHLVGPRYLESRLSSWAVCHVSMKPHASLRGRLKTGHWYQFRVAAVNGNGSRGYSQPSRPFKTKGEWKKETNSIKKIKCWTEKVFEKNHPYILMIFVNNHVWIIHDGARCVFFQKITYIIIIFSLHLFEWYIFCLVLTTLYIYLTYNVNFLLALNFI